MMTDPIADMLTRIKNGYMARRTMVSVPWSKMKQQLAKLLVESGYLEKQEMAETKGAPRQLILTLKYQGKVPSLVHARRISRPSLRVYASKGKLPRVLGGAGTAVVSTPQGLMTAKEAGKRGLGGEVICEIW